VFFTCAACVEFSMDGSKRAFWYSATVGLAPLAFFGSRLRWPGPMVPALAKRRLM
jgi:hypothetical protein